MRYGLIADIHANFRALRVALTCLNQARVDRVLVLGDLIGYGAEPGQCVDLIRSQKNITAISGNHDRQLVGDADPQMRRTAARALDWTKSVLRPEQVEYLRKLPQGQALSEEGMVLVHGSLVSRDAYILTMNEVEENRRLMLDTFAGTRLCFFAHTHVPLLIGMNSVVSELKETKAFKLDKRDVYLINPGSVGQPRDKCPLSSFGLFDTENWTMTFFRKPYDIRGAKMSIKEAGLPAKFAKRLEVGS